MAAAVASPAVPGFSRPEAGDALSPSNGGRDSCSSSDEEEERASRRSPSLESLPRVNDPEARSAGPAAEILPAPVPSAAPTPAVAEILPSRAEAAGPAAEALPASVPAAARSEADTAGTPSVAATLPAPAAEGGLLAIAGAAAEASKSGLAHSVSPGLALPPGAIESRAVPSAALPGAAPTPPSALAAASEAGVKQFSPASPDLDASPGLEEAAKSSLHSWEEAELPQIQQENNQVLRVFCGVWNLHGKHAPADLSPWLPTIPRHHLYVIGTCECERSIEKSLIWSNKANWERQVGNHLGEDFRMIGAENMGAIHLMVFVHRHLWKYCGPVQKAQVATGFANWIGNKGGTQVGFTIGHTSILFVNAHLPAHANKMKERTQSFSRILADSPIRKARANAGVHEEYDRVFFMGDLNPRLNAKRDQVDLWLSKRQFEKCLECDQLLPLMRASAGELMAGLWHHFDEAPIQFPPTYKFDKCSDIYDTSKKRRVPSWTDRILWKRDPHIKSLSYGCVMSMQVSDHKPVFGQFEVSVDLGDWDGPPPGSDRRPGSSVCSVQ
eukprot:TRINITY_DN7067_c0_g1_i1.p1 TRINITY_DN7067_c0_g1~~TRINITY_DN7067_c0_g1_i1.p1  ORF type:complete len:565 (-),score=114.12 TRINITY_DN7067_c0_g1_i1:39-1703(-)